MLKEYVERAIDWYYDWLARHRGEPIKDSEAIGFFTRNDLDGTLVLTEDKEIEYSLLPNEEGFIRPLGIYPGDYVKIQYKSGRGYTKELDRGDPSIADASTVFRFVFNPEIPIATLFVTFENQRPVYEKLETLVKNC